MISVQLRRVILYAALAVLCAYVGVGVRYAAYRPLRSDAYLWVVYHVHSDMSDGVSSAEEIGKQARAAGVNMVILTDHGAPNLQATNFHAVVDGVRIVGGSEATLRDGHFTFFGAGDTPEYFLSSSAPYAMDDVREWGAFPVVAYPADRQYGWRYWESDLYPGGIEILNLFTSLRETSLRARVELAMFYPFSRYYFLRNITFPRESRAHWDEFLRHSAVWGFAASDAHGGFHVGKRGVVKAPSYEDAFSLAGLGVDRAYADDPLRAIRGGDFFVCVRGAGEPGEFHFTAEADDGTRERSGGVAAMGSGLSVGVDAMGQEVRIVLIKDGVAVRETLATKMDVPHADAGVYRVEVYLPHHLLLRPDEPWIVSNPIFVGVMPRPQARFMTAVKTGAAQAPNF